MKKLILVFIAILSFGTSNAFGQVSLNDLVEINYDVVGWGIWYGQATLTLDAASVHDSNEVIGYIDALSTDFKGTGFSIAINFGHFGINIGQDKGSTDIGKYADIQQNSDPNDDVYLIEGTRVNTSYTLLFQPVRYLFIGYGSDRGHFEFQQRNSSGVKETNKIAYDNPFYSFGLAAGFDPAKHEFAPIITAYMKIPQSRGNFSGTVMGLGVGVYF